ncbi:MAG: hypothetical protein M0006_05615 [Magnetospirillum sp.]|nr:hypothetical protein [Magnetospirillum sp.]
MRVPNVANAANVNTQTLATPASTQAAARKEDTSNAGNPSATYPSPVSALDAVTGASVLQYRDPRTGNVIDQVPSRAVLQYEQAQRLDANNAKAASTA